MDIIPGIRRALYQVEHPLRNPAQDYAPLTALILRQDSVTIYIFNSKWDQVDPVKV